MVNACRPLIVRYNEYYVHRFQHLSAETLATVGSGARKDTYYHPSVNKPTKRGEIVHNTKEAAARCTARTALPKRGW